MQLLESLSLNSQSEERDINISLQLEIMGDNKVIVPGCEPASALSNKTLASWLSKSGCGSAIVSVFDILNAIPGSYIKFGTNYNRLGYRQKWLVLPPIYVDCPCIPYDDYYKIIRGLATDELPIEEKYDSCDMIGMGFCPSPDFQTIPPPEANPYKPEHAFPAGTGVLPPIPPWDS